MKLDQLRKIIREEVRAAVKEELQEVMNEAVKAASTPSQEVEKKQVVQPEPVKRKPGTGSITEMLNQTKASMTADEYKNVFTGTADMVQKPNFASMMAGNMGMTPSAGPQPGLDISQFDFVKKAGAVYNAAIEKDKQKYGLV